MVPMHMPGHKRNTSLSGKGGYLEKLGAFADITEIDGFDNLNAPHGLFLQSMQKAAALWRSEETLFSVNGSTGGILAAIYGSVPYGGKVIIARNCHKAVYNALELRGAEVVYALPRQNCSTGIWGTSEADTIAALLDNHPDTRLVIVTSPTFEGIVSDIRKICGICHGRKIPLMVDEAHGCHLGFGYGFPESAVNGMADIVVESIHKTLAGLTQTALVHLNGSLIDRREIRRGLTVFQSSSPSYILSASIDGCIRLLKQHGSALFENWQRNLDRFYEHVCGLKHLSFLQKTDGIFAFDRSKIVILTGSSGLTGKALARILQQRYRIEPEMSAPAYVIAMTGIGDTWDNLRRLADALIEIDETCSSQEQNFVFPEFVLPEKVWKASETEPLAKTAVSLSSAAGHVSGEYIMAYPPGVPLLVPGEKITPSVVWQIRSYLQCGINMISTYSGLPEKIFVIKTEPKLESF
ncbi:MAG: aminotransferase class I/II-fold pyridoxal phosphate-dependent enzyme [Oscillospiraceae bacterium]